MQQRSRETFEKLCAAALSILDEGGITALNTNAVAERAGVSITAVYSYFPDKFAILHELYMRVEQQRLDQLIQVLDQLTADEDWRPVLHDVITRAARAREAEPNTLALRRAMSSIPALAELGGQGNLALADRLSRALRARNGELKPAEAERAARILIAAAGAALDACIVDGKVDRRALREVIAMAESYVESLVEARKATR